MGRHLWYLGQELTPLALFSDQLSPQVKHQIVFRLKQIASETASNERSVRYCGKEDLSEKTLEYFIGPPHVYYFVFLR